MDKRFYLKVLKAFEMEYVKVFCLNPNDLDLVWEFLSLDSQWVKKANITNGKDITIYPTPFYTAQEVKEHLDTTLDYFYANIYPLGSVSFSINELSEICEKSGMLYQEGLIKIRDVKTLRNGFDDLRLGMELFLKSLLRNNAPLEKQSHNLKNWLQRKGASVQVRNLIVDYISRWSIYQNENVKHDDRCEVVEITIIVKIYDLIIKQLLEYDKVHTTN